MKLSQLLDDVASDLGDWPDKGGPRSFRNWSRELLISRFNEANCLIATTYKPKDFHSTKIVKLAYGSLQDFSACCQNVVSISEQVSADGQLVTTLSTSTKKNARDWNAIWSKKACATAVPGKPYVIDQVMRNQGTTAVFSVSPPVPYGTDAYVKLVCGGVPGQVTDLNADVSSCKYLAAIRSYMLSTALAKETESQLAQNSSKDHFNRFLGLLGAQAKMEKERADDAS
jgi:hypothetical protein